MASDHILRVPRSDSEGDFVLVNVASNGDRPLDVKILATEGENPYGTTIRQSRISKLRDKRSQLNDEQWATILRSSLLHQRREIKETLSLAPEQLEIVATIAGDTLAIHFRNNISGITQKLGEILLKQDDSQEIDSVSWAGSAVLRSTQLEAEVQDLTSKYEEQTRTITHLNKQLEDLISAKKDHEDALLEKFRELLNAKKLKIRDQQRLLAGAKVNPKQAEKVQNARQTKKSHTPKASRAGKRKAEGDATASQSSDDDSFEPKAPTQKEEDEDSEQVNTPEASDQDVTEDESDDDLDSAPAAAALPDRTKATQSGDAPDGDMQVDSPPKARELPFGKSDVGKGTERVKEAAAEDMSTLNQEAGNEDEETEDDDDEL